MSSAAWYNNRLKEAESGEKKKKYLFIIFQTNINIPLEKLPVNTALVLLIDPEVGLKTYRTKAGAFPTVSEQYNTAMQYMEQVTF